MRASMLAIALVTWLASSLAVGANCDGFTDVDSGASYCTAVVYLKDHGITLGCTGTTFCPDAFVTRAQMALFLQRSGQGHPTNSLGDYTNTIGGGGGNLANTPGAYATVGGGTFNSATGARSTIAGGAINNAGGQYAVVGGGVQNTASGISSTVPGGQNNGASGGASFAAGSTAQANADGCFVWGDASTSNTISCNANNRFVVRSLGGIFMFTGGTDQASYTGLALAPGGSAWIVGSDRNGKEEFKEVDAEAVLRKVTSLPISTWKWKNQDASVRHMGPMAQDFSEAFGLGETPKGISTVDADGVALAAIQGLHKMLVARDSVISEQATALIALRARVESLERAGTR